MSKFELSKESGPHFKLSAFAGNWKGSCKTWFEKDVLDGEEPMTGKVAVILDGRFILYTYNGTLGGKPYEGYMTWGYDLANDKCQCSWIDSFHMGTGIMLSEGTSTKTGFSVLGSYSTPEFPIPWNWRTELEMNGEDTFTITAFNISPEGEEAKATETIYHRIH